MNIITNDKQLCLQAIDALHGIIDPEMNISVIDLGLIYQIDFEELSKKMFVTMTLSTQFCPMGESLTNGVKSALEKEFDDYQVVVFVTFIPKWNRDRISEAGKKILSR